MGWLLKKSNRGTIVIDRVLIGKSSHGIVEWACCPLSNFGLNFDAGRTNITTGGGCKRADS